jgi:hypothetical protein
MPSLSFGKLRKRTPDGSGSDSGTSTPRSTSNPFSFSSISKASSLQRSASSPFSLSSSISELKLGDAPQPREKHQKVTPRELRELRELIIDRYSLDIELHTLRDAKSFQKDKVEEKMRSADAKLMKIRKTVAELDSRQYWETEEGFEKWKEVKKRVMEPGKREWRKNPPWNDKRSY